jgi:putative NADPH-quinone reductase
MGRQIVVIQGHPDSTARHFGQALADAYTDGARQGDHSVTLIRVAELDFPLLHTKEEWSEGELPPGLKPAQKAISAADHIVIFYHNAGTPALEMANPLSLVVKAHRKARPQSPSRVLPGHGWIT